MMYDEIRREVDRLFAAEAPARFDELCRNPVTGGRWVKGRDPIEEQKRDACRALRARAWFAQNGPQDVQPLPLSYGEREDLKRGGSTLERIVAWFARSLEARNYACDEHPSFPDFARGVLASPEAPWFITEDQELPKRYPPRALPGLGSGFYWDPVQ
jgi:glutathione S-transferase